MEAWRKTWREAAALLAGEALGALRRALADDDPRLLQGATTAPPPCLDADDWPVEAACPLALCGWLGHGLETVGQVEEFFAAVCRLIDVSLDEQAGCRWFFNWVDETPREVMRRELLAEVELSLKERSRAEGQEA